MSLTIEDVFEGKCGDVSGWSLKQQFDLLRLFHTSSALREKIPASAADNIGRLILFLPSDEVFLSCFRVLAQHAAVLTVVLVHQQVAARLASLIRSGNPAFERSRDIAGALKSNL